MYSAKEIKVSLRKYIASTGDTSIDEQSIINILDQGADRDFYKVAPTIRSIRENYGVKKSIPKWLQMLTFRLIFDCLDSDAEYNSEMTWYRLMGYDSKVRDIFCNIGLEQNIQDMLLCAKGDKIAIDEIFLGMILGNESQQIMKELQKQNVADSTKQKLNDIGIAQDIQERIWKVEVKDGKKENKISKEKQIKEILIKSALGSDYEQVYNLLLSQAKSQENLLKVLGFNKKVFDSSSSWQMYSPEMKLRQSRFTPVDFPFSYAEVESNPIYVAMLHHLISEARVLTNTFVDVFGKMGYVPAFCAEGYAHKLIFTNETDTYLKYYHGITDRPTRTYKVLQGYFDKISEVLSDNYLTREERHEKIQEKLFDTNTVLLLTNLLETNTDMEYRKYAAAKFCQMCLNNPYWEDRNVGEHSVVVNKKKRLNGGKLIDSKKQIEIVDADRFIEEDYSSIIRLKKFISISKDNFIAYTHALKKVEYVNKTDSLLSFIFKNFNQYASCIDSYIDYDYSGNLCQELKRVAYHETPLLYVDAPKYGEYNRFSFDSVKYMRLLESLLLYNGDWILTFKNYNHERVYYGSEEFSVKHFRERMKASERPLFEYKYSTNDRNIRNSISFITTIDFDELTAQEFKHKYNIMLKTNDTFKKLKVN